MPIWDDGHEPIRLYRSPNDRIPSHLRHHRKNTPLCRITSTPDEARLPRLLLYTDGIPEARNGNSEYLTTGPILKIAKENLDLSAEELQVRILQELSEFVGDAPQSDDITPMIFARDRLD
ncbi:MAG: SpoIIE family protein phosphatase [Anaerolineales bacterium]